MPFYQQRGQIPHKRHTQFPKADGTLHHEQLFGTIGFVGMSSLLYHLYPPTMVKSVSEPVPDRWKGSRKTSNPGVCRASPRRPLAMRSPPGCR